METTYKAIEKILYEAFADFFYVQECRVTCTRLGWLCFYVKYYNTFGVCVSETLHAPEELERWPEKLFATLVIDALEREYQ